MNGIYLLTMSVFAVLATTSWKQWWDDAISAVLTMVAFFMFVFGFVFPLGTSVEHAEPAVSTKVGSDVIVQVDGWKTMAVSDLKFVGRDLEMVQKVTNSAFGFPVDTDYSVRIRKSN